MSKKESKKKEKKGHGSSSSSSSSSDDDKKHKKDKGHADKGHADKGHADKGHADKGHAAPGSAAALQKKVILRKEDYTRLKHDLTKIGGKSFSKRQGLYGVPPGHGGAAASSASGAVAHVFPGGSAADAGAGVHAPLDAGSVAHAYTSFPEEVKTRVDVLSSEMAATAPAVTKSSLAGKKRALLIGINYVGSAVALRGCINDVANIKAFVSSKFGFPTDAQQMRVLTDEQADASLRPTRANIIAGIQWLREGAASGDSLFLHYSGHGATQADEGPVFDEPTGMDETLVPLDYETAGMITDDEIHEILLAPLAPGVRLTCITDCCHSGSILDLPYTYVLETAVAAPTLVDNRKVALATALASGMTFGESATQSAMKTALAEGHLETTTVTAAAMQLRITSADVVHISGCRDDQTSADAFIGGENVGAMSHALIHAFDQLGPSQTFAQLLENMRNILKGKYKQVPMLSTGYAGGILTEPLKM
jgi:hypothetical protein